MIIVHQVRDADFQNHNSGGGRVVPWLAYGWKGHMKEVRLGGEGKMGERESFMSSGSAQSNLVMICFCSCRPEPRKSCRSWAMCRKYFTRGKWVWWNWQPDRLARCNLWPPILSLPQNGCHRKPASSLPWVGYLGRGRFVPLCFIRAHECWDCGCLRCIMVVLANII